VPGDRRQPSPDPDAREVDIMPKSVAVITLTVVLVLQAATARAQNTSDSAKKNVFAGSPLTWSVDPILDRYVSTLARTYNLNKDQEEYTRQLLNQRVKRFLGEYEGDVRSLFTEYLYLQSSGELPTQDVAQDLAKRGGPLIAAIRKEIFDGNMKWREILDEKQRQMHDRDLQQMTQQFDQLQQTMDNWRNRKVSPTDLGRRAIAPPISIRRPEDAWEMRVNSFISEYRLDAGQQETARSIMRELREEAGRYREKRQEDFAAIDKKIKEITESGPKTDPEEQKKAQETVSKLIEQKVQLEQPIREDLWRQLMARLERIPTEDQRRVRNERMAKIRTGVLTTRRSTSGPAETQPEVASSSVESRPAARAQADR
jgi:hypothetical protein